MGAHPGTVAQLAIHDAVRRDLARLAAALADGTTPPPVVLRAYWRELAGQLGHHHEFEDATVWPLMAERLGDRVVGVLDQNAREHEAMAAAIDDFDAVLAASADPASVRSTLSALTATVEEHLEHEEAAVLPLAPDAFTPADVAAFVEASARENPPDAFLPWVLDEANDDTVAFFTGALPAPVRTELESTWIPRRRMRVDARELTGRVGALAALDAAYRRATGITGDLSPSQLGAPTPCTDWDVRAVLNHMLGTIWMFTAANQGRAVGEDAGDLVAGEPGAALTEAVGASLAAWGEPRALDGDRVLPFGTFPATAASFMNLAEVVVHSWDIARAVGADATIDPTAAEMLLDFYRSVSLDGYRAHGAYGPEVTTTPDASAADQLLGLLGRDPRWSS